MQKKIFSNILINQIKEKKIKNEENKIVEKIDKIISLLSTNKSKM
jgi:hypothetical protein